MSTRKSAKKQKAGLRPGRVAHPRDEVKLSKKNWTILGASLAVIIVGYVFLANGSITIAPLLLVVGYCVMIPYAILARD